MNYIKSKQQEQHKRVALDPTSDEDIDDSNSQLTTPGGRQTVF
ncbi:MAG TPA: hypothetical protein VI278_12380 [Nitrososphaeraceae archaeon]